MSNVTLTPIERWVTRKRYCLAGIDRQYRHSHSPGILDSGRRSAMELCPLYSYQPDVRGRWMYHCHVNDHINAVMMTSFIVE